MPVRAVAPALPRELVFRTCGRRLIHRECRVDFDLIIHSLNAGSAVYDFHGLDFDVRAWHLARKRYDTILYGNIQIRRLCCVIGKEIGLNAGRKLIIVDGLFLARGKKTNHRDR